MKKLAAQMPEIGRSLVDVKGKDIVKLVGEDTIKSVIVSLLCGENIRNLTERLTRRRLNISNGALLGLFLKGCQSNDFIEKLPYVASKEITGKPSKKDKVILQWLLGLTGKAVQNVLRGDKANLTHYVESTEKSVTEAIGVLEDEVGEIGGSIYINDHSALLDWQFILRLFTAVGAQTLSIRGAEKSLYGKLFERLVLGSLLTILGFEFIDNLDDAKKSNMVFWLSERGEKRESDATLLLRPGKGIRFDMGFIGVGNTEISLDKVSRFERYMDLGLRRHFMLTFVIIDRIGKGSRIVELAKEIDGTIVQMSMAYWPKIIVNEMNNQLKFKHELLSMPSVQVHKYLTKRLRTININDFL